MPITYTKKIFLTEKNQLHILCNVYPIASLLLFAPLAQGAVQGWAVGILFLLCLTTGAFSLLQKQNTFTAQRSPLDKSIAALFILTICSSFFSVHRYTSIIAIAQLLTCLLLYYSVLQIINKRYLLNFIVYWIIGISTLLCIIGMVKLNDPSIFPWWDYSGAQYPDNWLSATFLNHNHMAGWLEMSIPILLCLIIFDCQKKWRILQFLLLLLQVTSLILTYSRGGWAGAAVATVFIYSWILSDRNKNKKRRITLYLCLGIFVIGFLGLLSLDIVQRLHSVFVQGNVMENLADRVIVWHGTLAMIRENLLTGTGPGTYALAFCKFQPPGISQRYYMAHNDYLQFTAELGIGAVPLILVMGKILFQNGLRKMKSPSRQVRAVTLGCLAGITSILIHSAVDFNLHIPSNALLFSVLAAIVVHVPQSEGNDKLLT